MLAMCEVVFTLDNCMDAKNIALVTKRNIDGVVPMTRSMRTKHVPVRSLDYSGRVINVTKRLDMSDKTYSRLVYYSQLAHEDPRVRRLRDLREKFQKSTFEYMAKEFDHIFEDKLQNAKAHTTHDILHVSKKRLRMQRLKHKLHIS